MSMKPEVAQKTPYAVAVESGKTYYWCSCGKRKASLFAMAHIRVAHSRLWHLPRRKIKRCISVAAKLLPINLFVMAHTANSN